MTCWRRLRDWQADGTWAKIHKASLDRLREADLIDWSRAAVDRAQTGAAYGGEAKGPSPVDRSKPGSKHHLMTDGQGIPRSCSVTASNVNDIDELATLFNAIPPVAGKPGHPKSRPDAVLGDRGYDSEPYRQGLCQLGVEPLLAKTGTENGSGLGKVRWVVERTLSWFHQNRRLRIRDERRVDIHQAVLTLACIKVCASFLFDGYC
jgi:transposase